MLEVNTVEVNTLAVEGPIRGADLKDDQFSRSPFKRLCLVLCVASLSALAGAMAAWLVVKFI